MVQWFDDLDEGVNPNWTEDERKRCDLQVEDEDKTKDQLQLLQDTYS